MGVDKDLRVSNFKVRMLDAELRHHSHLVCGNVAKKHVEIEVLAIPHP